MLGVGNVIVGHAIGDTADIAGVAEQQAVVADGSVVALDGPLIVYQHRAVWALAVVQLLQLVMLVVAHAQGVEDHLVEEEELAVHQAHVAIEPSAHHAVGLVVLRNAGHGIHQQLAHRFGRVLGDGDLPQPAAAVGPQSPIGFQLGGGEGHSVAVVAHQGIDNAAFTVFGRHFQHILAVVVGLGVDGLSRHTDGDGRQPLAGVTVGDTSAKGQVVLLSLCKTKN